MTPRTPKFYAVLSRMKYITRWALMRNTRPENICEHSQDVAVLAHALALLTNRRFAAGWMPPAASLSLCITTRPRFLPAICPRL